MPEFRFFFRKEMSESGTKYPTARVTNKDRTVTVRSDYTGSVNLKVYDLGSTTPTTAVFETNRTVAATFFNSLQTWAEDPQGYNFQDTAGVTSNDVSWNGGHTYRFCYRATHVTEGVHTIAFEGKPHSLFGA